MKRVLWAMDHIGWKDEWSKVIFSEKKKFNLDGPDGVKHYWHDLRQSEKCFFSRHSGGSSIMIWAAISANGKNDLAFIENKMESKLYTTAVSYTHVLMYDSFLVKE